MTPMIFKCPSQLFILTPPNYALNQMADSVHDHDFDLYMAIRKQIRWQKVEGVSDVQMTMKEHHE